MPLPALRVPVLPKRTTSPAFAQSIKAKNTLAAVLPLPTSTSTPDLRHALRSIAGRRPGAVVFSPP